MIKTIYKKKPSSPNNPDDIVFDWQPKKKEKMKNDGTSYFKDGTGAQYGLFYATTLASLLR